MAVEDLMAGMMAEVQGQLGRSVVLRARAVGSFNATTGARTRGETDYTLVAVMGQARQFRDGGLLKEERAYTFAAADLANGVIPLETWHVIDAGVEWPIVRVDKGASGQAYACVCRRERKTGS